MDNKTWKDLHEHDTGYETVRLLIDEVENMMRARCNANGYPNGYPADYWVEEEKHHAERVAWLEKKLVGMLECKEGFADADGEGPVSGGLEADRAGG